MRNLNCFAESAIIAQDNGHCKENEERAHKTHCIGDKVEIKDYSS